MNDSVIRRLIALNTDFYIANAASFSNSRQTPWPGWQICLEVLRSQAGFNLSAFSVLDLACGNLRFADFLTSEFPQAEMAYYALDNYAGFVPRKDSVCFYEFDILSALLADDRVSLSNHSPLESLAIPRVDLAVCFGFMHHVPGQLMRKQVLDMLIQQTSPGGLVVVSFWRFMNDERMADNARRSTATGLDNLNADGTLIQLGLNDCLLGWQGSYETLRYCHSFTESEIDSLVASVSGRATELTRFAADGRTGDLNAYVILKVTG